MEAASLATIEQFKNWTRTELRRVFPHEMLVSGYGTLHAGGVSLDCAVTVDFPAGYLSCIRNRAGGLDSPVLRAFLATGEPQLFEAERPPPASPAAWLDCFRRYDLRNIAAFGRIDAERCVATYHSFHRVPGPLGPGHAEALMSLVPTMHEALCRALEGMQPQDGLPASLARLTQREKEVVDLVCLGRSNGDIAFLFHLSENTVKHHLTNVFDKLGIESRAQLMRLAAHAARRAISGALTIL